MSRTSGDATRLAVALIGAGRIGRIHAGKAAAHPALESALADPAVAGVIVASPTDQHLTHCLQAAASGKAIFCESSPARNPSRAAPTAVFVGLPPTYGAPPLAGSSPGPLRARREFAARRSRPAPGPGCRRDCAPTD